MSLYSPEIGITPTPVIDTETGTIFVLTRTRTGAHLVSSARYSQQIHALAITTGREKFGGPVEIRASLPGTGEGSSGGKLDFNALRENPARCSPVDEGRCLPQLGFVMRRRSLSRLGHGV